MTSKSRSGAESPPSLCSAHALRTRSAHALGAGHPAGGAGLGRALRQLTSGHLQGGGREKGGGVWNGLEIHRGRKEKK